MMDQEKILVIHRRESTVNLAASRSGRNLRSLVIGPSYISGWLRKSRLKHLHPTGFEDRIDTRIRAFQQGEVVECMCKDMVPFDSPRRLQMITSHLFPLPYWLGNQTIPRCPAAPPGVLR
jgi:hypothetical protein